MSARSFRVHGIPAHGIPVHGGMTGYNPHQVELGPRGSIPSPDGGTAVRYAFVTSTQRSTWEWMLDVWLRADRSGVFESGWTFDHLYAWPEPTSDDCLEGWMTLSSLLSRTERVRGGVLVTGMAYRHPGVLANMASTLDIVSGGRLELGVGAGSTPQECEAFGIEAGSTKERFDRLEEGLAVLESLLTKDRTTFRGRYYTLSEAMNNPKPVQAPLPITIGGRGRRRTLPLVARYASHWNYGRPDDVEFAELRHELFRACAEIGRDPGGLTCSALVPYQGDDGAFLKRLDALESAGADMVLIALAPEEPADVIDRIADLVSVR